MNSDYLSIEINQIRNKLSELSEVQYFSKSLRSFQNKLIQLAEKIEANPSINASRISEYLEFIRESIIYLEDSTLNITPYETVFCLDKVLQNWLDEVPVIVTSLKSNNYHFKGTLSDLGKLPDLIKADFQIEFNEELLQIGIPQLEVYNYLYNIVIYHEVGHFIDQYYNISSTVAAEVYHIKNDTSKSYDETEQHLMEHFCDIFAAQYIGPLINEYLDFKEANAPDSESHPSTKKRIKVVNDFLNGQQNSIVDQLKKVVLKECENRELKTRFKIPQPKNFKNFIPCILKSEKELHGVYQTAWQMWRKRKDIYKGLSDKQAFEVVNNLTGKSIANYMIKEKWSDGYID